MIQDRKTLYKALTMPSAGVREKAVDNAIIVSGTGTSALQLSYRPPYDWLGMLAFLKVRELKGVEWVTGSFTPAPCI